MPKIRSHVIDGTKDNTIRRILLEALAERELSLIAAHNEFMDKKTVVDYQRDQVERHQRAIEALGIDLKE